MRTPGNITEAQILADVIRPSRAGWSPESARSILRLKFGADAAQRIRRLLHKNNRGTITIVERIVLEKYLRVGQMLDLLQAKARLSLRHAARAS